MTHATQSQQVLDLIRQRGLLRSSELEGTGVHRSVLSRLVTSGKLEKISRGIYRLPDAHGTEHETLASIAIRLPHAVFCLLTALQFHEITTQLPRQVWIAMPRGSHTPRIDYPPIKMVQFSGEAYQHGIEVYERDQVRLRVYGVAKTVVDCFKHRNQIGLDVAIEALKEALAQHKVSQDDLWRAAKVCRMANIMRPYLEAIA